MVINDISCRMDDHHPDILLEVTETDRLPFLFRSLCRPLIAGSGTVVKSRSVKLQVKKFSVFIQLKVQTFFHKQIEPGNTVNRFIQGRIRGIQILHFFRQSDF